MKKKLKKKTRYRIIVCSLISLGCITYFIFSLIYYSLNVAKLQQEKTSLTATLKELQAKEQELSSEIVKLKDPDYVARYARENYLYSKDGEYIIKIDRSNNTKASSDKKEKNEPAEIILIGAGLGALLIIIGTIIHKKRKQKK